MDIKKFLETKPLYSKEIIKPPIKFHSDIQPKILNLECPICKGKQPFHSEWVETLPPAARLNPGKYKAQIDSGINELEYTCQGCELELFTFYVEVHQQTSSIVKVGQNPPYNISIPKKLNKTLGDDSILLKRAKMCVSQGYGIGACAYLRRLIENQINPILQMIYDVLKSESEDKAKLDEIEKTIKGKVFDDKLKIAYSVLPNPLIVDGQNPLKIIYDNLSGGIHGKDEDECIKIAEKLSFSVEFVITELSGHLENKTKFIESIRKITSKK